MERGLLLITTSLSLRLMPSRCLSPEPHGRWRHGQNSANLALMFHSCRSRTTATPQLINSTACGPEICSQQHSSLARTGILEYQSRRQHRRPAAAVTDRTLTRRDASNRQQGAVMNVCSDTRCVRAPTTELGAMMSGCEKCMFQRRASTPP